MKHFVLLFKLFCISMLTLFALSCRKVDESNEPGTPNGTSIHADTISNHLLFSNATKITGTIPKGPATSSLKISFEDTLYLVDKWKLPVKFLHEDTTKNVSGVYVQVHVGATGGTFYYDVPEVPDIATNDLVSVVLIGIDPDGLIDTTGVPPAGAPPFEITLVPHDPDGVPVGEVTVPVDISAPATDPLGECGLVTKPGDYWQWSMSFIPDPNNPLGKDLFFNSPNKLWGLKGQLIQGVVLMGYRPIRLTALKKIKEN